MVALQQIYLFNENQERHNTCPQHFLPLLVFFHQQHVRKQRTNYQKLARWLV